MGRGGADGRTRFGWVLREEVPEGRTVPPKVSPDELWRRIVDGRWRPVVRRAKYVGSVHKADNSALLSHIAQLDRSLRGGRKALRRKARSQAHKSADMSALPAPARAKGQPCE